MAISSRWSTVCIAAASCLGGYLIGMAGKIGPSLNSSEASAQKNDASVVVNRGATSNGAAGGIATETIGKETSTTMTAAQEALMQSILGDQSGNEFLENPGDDIAAWLASDPETVVAFLAPSIHRDEWFTRLFSRWATQDPAAASRWVADHPSAPGRDSMAAGLATGVAKEDGHAAVKWGASIKDPALKLKTSDVVGFELYRTSETTALEGLKDIGLPESANEMMLVGWQQQFRAKMKRDAQNIAAVATSAMASGAEIDTSSLETVMSQLESGVHGVGEFSTTLFQLSKGNWSERERTAIQKLISLTDASISYTPPSN